jgi:hypothetical protein
VFGDGDAVGEGVEALADLFVGGFDLWGFEGRFADELGVAAIEGYGTE